MKRRRYTVATTATLAAMTAMAVGISTAPAAQESAAAPQPAGASGLIQGAKSTARPDGALGPAANLSAGQRDALAKAVQDRSELASRISGGTAAAPGGADSDAAGGHRPTGIAAESEAASVTRNQRNLRSSQVSSTLAEPSAANDGTEVQYGGNTYWSRSANSGVSWTAESISSGPSDAPFVCCDLDVVHHPALDTTFSLALYTNGSATNGVVRIWVRRSTIAGGNDCSYTIDPGGTGTMLPDYPHMAVSNGFVYLTTNNINGAGSWAGSQIRRFNANQMANCLGTATTTWTYTGTDGQRILTPVENASTTQYFGLNRTGNVFRVLRLPESTTTLSQFDRTLPTSTAFINSDCRGGTGNFDMIERSTSWSIAGFRLRGAVVPNNRVWFVWNAGRDASHPQAHLHSAILSEPGMTLLASPPVWNGSTCFGYGTLGANTQFGEFGLTLAYGGRNGGGGAAAQGAIAVDDASSAGNFFPALLLTASGTHNRSDGRYGDYFTMRRNDKCSYGWVGTNYALSGGNTSAAHVNARYVELQSGLHAACP